MSATSLVWPPLPLREWSATRDTLHMWTQIVGKTRLALAPMVNHWWQVPLYVSARGLTTSWMPYGTEGFYGVPIYVSATYIFLFILFGSFLERAGMIQLFTDVSLGLFGSTRGGPAKVAVFASGMMGTISGSGVANVVTVGQFTIHLAVTRAKSHGGSDRTAACRDPCVAGSRPDSENHCPPTRPGP